MAKNMSGNSRETEIRTQKLSRCSQNDEKSFQVTYIVAKNRSAKLKYGINKVIVSQITKYCL